MTYTRLQIILADGNPPEKSERDEIISKCIEMRKDQHQSQSDVARALGMSRQAVSQAEAGITWSRRYIIYFMRFLDFPNKFQKGGFETWQN